MAGGLLIPILGSAIFAGGILIMCVRYRRALQSRAVRDRQYQDRVRIGSARFRQALELSDNECGDWPLVPDLIHNGEASK